MQTRRRWQAVVCTATISTVVAASGATPPNEPGLDGLLAYSPYIAPADLERYCVLDSVTLEREPYAADGAAYTVTFFASGAVEYEGRANVKPRGRRHGVVARRDFARLCQVVMISHFDAYADTYPGNWFHGPTAYVTVVERGKPKTVSDFDESGPTGLWTLERVMGDLANRIEWQRGPGPAPLVRRTGSS
jgi:hypothetical protein